MDHGKIIARGNPGNLVTKHAKHVAVVLPKSSFKNRLEKLKIKHYELDNFIEIQTNDINLCIKELIELEADLSNMTVRSPNLEDVFIHLTGRTLRE